MSEISLEIKKDRLAQRLPQRASTDADYPFCLRVNLHGVPLVFHLTSEKLFELLTNHFPEDWRHRTAGAKKPLKVFWHDPRQDGLWDDADADCRLRSDAHGEFAWQRDFVAADCGDRIYLACREEIDDGFFNFLRWLMPRKMLTLNRLLLHSSCVVDGRGRAYLCLGESGAGKTTIAGLACGRPVLGDDMNVLLLENGLFKVTPDRKSVV